PASRRGRAGRGAQGRRRSGPGRRPGRLGTRWWGRGPPLPWLRGEAGTARRWGPWLLLGWRDRRSLRPQPRRRPPGPPEGYSDRWEDQEVGSVWGVAGDPAGGRGGVEPRRRGDVGGGAAAGRLGHPRPARHRRRRGGLVAPV